jgi:hypothetical protein
VAKTREEKSNKGTTAMAWISRYGTLIIRVLVLIILAMTIIRLVLGDKEGILTNVAFCVIAWTLTVVTKPKISSKKEMVTTVLMTYDNPKTGDELDAEYKCVMEEASESLTIKSVK